MSGEWRRFPRMRVGFASLTALVLAMAGCATVPDETQPEVVRPVSGNGNDVDVPKPESGIDTLTVVRKFVEANGQPLGRHAYSRVYLDRDTQESWHPAGNLTIIEDSFNTVPAPADEQPKASDERTVLLTGTKLGKLDTSSAFIPSTSDRPIKVRVRLRQESNGEWRIVDPPDKVITTKSEFTEHYLRVPIYFFAESSATLVPDLRYVPVKPRKGLPSRVVDLLLDGPSDALEDAVRNSLGDKVALKSNVDTASDGVLTVPLSGVEGKSKQRKKRMVAQLVNSLREVQTFQVRPLSRGEPLIANTRTWRSSDLPAYGASSSLSSEVSGVFVADGRVYSLASGKPVSGDGGSGAYEIDSAGVSLGENQLAVVERTDDGAQLRVGPMDGTLAEVDLDGDSMTPPTWLPAASPDGSAQTVWTVVDGDRVVRVQRTSDGTWTPQKVDADALTDLGKVTQLRLSRDGSRVAAVVDDKLVVAAVVRDVDEVQLRAPRVLQQQRLDEVTDVAWAKQHRLVASTEDSSRPVVRLPVDGLRLETYDTANLTLPARGVTAAPSRPVIAADQRGLSKVSSSSDPWRPHEHSQPEAMPFYPG